MKCQFIHSPEQAREFLLKIYHEEWGSPTYAIAYGEALYQLDIATEAELEYRES